MTVRWALARHIADLERGETRNMGVVLVNDGQVIGRFLGERNGTVDLRTVRGMGAGPAYRSWVEYWRGQMLLGEAGLAEAMNASQPGENYFLQYAGELLVGEMGDAHEFLDSLFSKLVDIERAESVDPITETMKRAATILKYPLIEDVSFDVPVPDAEDRIDRLHFDFRIDNRVPHLFRRVSTGKDSNSVHATAWSFRSITEADLPNLRDVHCISLLRNDVEDLDAANLRVLEAYGPVLQAGSPESDVEQIVDLIKSF